MLWFPGMTTNKKWRPAEDRAHRLSLVILLGKLTSWVRYFYFFEKLP